LLTFFFFFFFKKKVIIITVIDFYIKSFMFFVLVSVD